MQLMLMMLAAWGRVMIPASWACLCTGVGCAEQSAADAHEAPFHLHWGADDVDVGSWRSSGLLALAGSGWVRERVLRLTVITHLRYRPCSCSTADYVMVAHTHTPPLSFFV